ncbi:MAG: hypothetical protein AAF639_45955, partial [Chloroflexota bacterium]
MDNGQSNNEGSGSKQPDSKQPDSKQPDSKQPDSKQPDSEASTNNHVVDDNPHDDSQNTSNTNSERDLFERLIGRSVSIVLKKIDADRDVPASDKTRRQALEPLHHALHSITSKLPKKSPLWTDASELLCRLSPKMIFAGEFDSWLPDLQQGIELAILLGDSKVEYTLQAELAFIYKFQGNLEKASILYRYILDQVKQNHLSSILQNERISQVLPQGLTLAPSPCFQNRVERKQQEQAA